MFLEVTKGIEHLHQNDLARLRFSDSESFLLKLRTMAMCFEHDIFHNNL